MTSSSYDTVVQSRSWSCDTLVQWHCGPVTPWSSDPLVQWQAGPLRHAVPMTLWSNDTSDGHWSNDTVVQWHHGPVMGTGLMTSWLMTQWSNNTLITWHSDTLNLWHSGSYSQCVHNWIKMIIDYNTCTGTSNSLLTDIWNVIKWCQNSKLNAEWHWYQNTAMQSDKMSSLL